MFKSPECSGGSFKLSLIVAALHFNTSVKYQVITQIYYKGLSSTRSDGSSSAALFSGSEATLVPFLCGVQQITLSKTFLLSGVTQNREKETVSWIMYQVFDRDTLAGRATRHLALYVGRLFQQLPPHLPYFFLCYFRTEERPLLLTVLKKRQVVNRQAWDSSL